MGNKTHLSSLRVTGPHWEDLRFPANGVSVGGLSTPPDVDPATGLLLFDGGVSVESIAICAQLPHAWKIQSGLRPHVHWRKTTDAAGGVVWSFRYKWSVEGELETDWSSVLTATDVFDPGAAQVQVVSNFPEIDTTGHGLSDMLICQIGRLPTDAGDTYAADVLLYEFDIHYLVDGFGSEETFSKDVT